MSKVIGGYVRYFNIRNNRTGPLFNNPFKFRHIAREGYLYKIIAYVTFNNLVHGINKGSKRKGVSFTAWNEELLQGTKIMKGLSNIANMKILTQGMSRKQYEGYARELLKETIKERELNRKRKKKSGLADELLE